MSGMTIKFTSLAQIEAHQFVPTDGRVFLHEAEGGQNPIGWRPVSAADRQRQGLTHYRIYQVDTKDHVVTGHSIECQSDAAAMDAACRLIEEGAAAVEVWESARRVGYLPTEEAAGPWDRLRKQWLGSRRGGLAGATPIGSRDLT